MNRKAGRWFANAIIAGALAGLLAGCGGGKTVVEDPNLYPTTYKKQILDTMTSVLVDPTNVRGAYITEPALIPVGNDSRYAVCIRSNSRDDSRHYLGSKDRIAYFFAGQLNQLVDATPAQCANAPYKPFPELEKLCLGNKCM